MRPENVGLSCQVVPSMLYSQPLTAVSVMLFLPIFASVAVGASGVAGMVSVIVIA